MPLSTRSVVVRVKVKVKVEHLYSAPSIDTAMVPPQRRSGTWHQAASYIPALYLPSRSQYSFTDPERMEGE